MRRRLPRLPQGLRLGLLLLAGLLPVLPSPVAALGEVPVATLPVNIDCHDGAPIHATVTPLQMQKIAGAAQAILESGSGDRCDVNNDSHDGQRESRTFVFGSGVYHDPTLVPPCPIHFIIKASIDEDGHVHGFQKGWFNDPNCLTSGSVSGDVECLSVTPGKVAQLKGVITQATGFFADPNIVPPLNDMTSDVQDTEGGLPDRIFQDPSAPSPPNICQAGTHAADMLPLDRGSIEVSP